MEGCIGTHTNFVQRCRSSSIRGSVGKTRILAETQIWRRIHQQIEARNESTRDGEGCRRHAIDRGPCRTNGGARAVAGELLLSAARAGVGMALVTPKEALVRVRRGWTLVDVRSAHDFCELRIPGALNVPFDPAPYFVARLALEGCETTDCIIVSCADGGVSGRAAVRMAACGFRAVACLYRGITAWLACGLPLCCDGTAKPQIAD